MKKAAILSLLVVLFVTMPIWFYLLYKILVAVNATDLMWFLFWVYMPASFFFQVMAKLAGDGK